VALVTAQAAVIAARRAVPAAATAATAAAPAAAGTAGTAVAAAAAAIAAAIAATTAIAAVIAAAIAATATATAIVLLTHWGRVVLLGFRSLRTGARPRWFVLVLHGPLPTIKWMKIRIFCCCFSNIH
jgi:hypothetical protein